MRTDPYDHAIARRMYQEKTMVRKEQRKLNHAYASIVSAIDRGEYDDAKYLPSIASLAEKNDVSVATVWLAIDRLKKEGRLAGAPGCRPVLSSRLAKPQGGTIDKPSLHRQTRSGTLQARIQRDILNGRLRHDRPLPADKDMTAAYGVSRRTLRKALHKLVEQGVLSRQGVRFSPVSIIPSASLTPQRIALIGPGTNIGQNITYGYWHQESYKLLELECAKARMKLDVGCFFHHEGELYMNDELPRICHYFSVWRPEVAGYIYLVSGPDSIEDELLRTVANAKRPVAIFDEMGTWPAPAFLKQHPNVRVFRNTISTLPAQQVARHLLELGHRTAVYLSPFNDQEYSRLRYEGLARSFADIDNARIVPITSHHETGQGSLPPEIESYVTTMRKSHAGASRTIPALYRDSAEAHFSSLSAAAEDWRIGEAVHVLCEQAVKIKDATAWILVNDACAVWALDFLEDRRIAVPGKISLISFDDLPTALTRGIASFNFNYPAVMVAMLGYITNPRLYPVSRQVIEIEGQIIPRRRTLGPRGRS